MASSRPSREIVTSTGWRITGSGAEALASSVEEAAAEAAERLTPGVPRDLVWAVSCTLTPRRPGVNAVDRVLEALAGDLRRGWPDAPIPRRDEGFAHPASRFGGVRWRVDPDPGKAWRGEALYRAVHPRVAGTPLTTRVLVEEMRSFIRLSAQVWADDGSGSMRGDVGVGQATPPFIAPLHETLQVTWMGTLLRPRTILPGDEPDFVRSVLEAPARQTPVVLLTPQDDGSFVVDPESFARELLGRALLYVVREPRQTFGITDELGDRRLSAYFGAARVYYQGFTRYDDGADHTLLIADRLSDPLMRAAFLGEIGRRLAPTQQLPEGIPSPEEGEGPETGPGARGSSGAPAAASPGAADVPTPRGGTPGDAGAPAVAPDSAEGVAGTAEGEAPAPSASPDTAPRESPASPPSTPSASPRAVPSRDAPAPGVGTAEFEALRSALAELGAGVGALRDGISELRTEVERLATVSGLRNASTAHLERRLTRIEEILERTFPDPDAPGGGQVGAHGVAQGEAEGREGDAKKAGGTPGTESGSGADTSTESRPDTLAEVVQRAAERHGDALLILPSAVEAAGKSPYEDPERIREILRAMATVSRRRQEGALGTGLKEAFEEYGVDYRGGISPSTSERLRQQYLFHLEGGEGVECFEHIAVGGTYNPRRCLRIYFSSKSITDSRFVIGHVGRHFEVVTST